MFVSETTPLDLPLQMFNCGFILFTVSVPKDEIDSDLHDIKVQVKQKDG